MERRGAPLLFSKRETGLLRFFLQRSEKLQFLEAGVLFKTARRRIGFIAVVGLVVGVDFLLQLVDLRIVNQIEFGKTEQETFRRDAEAPFDAAKQFHIPIAGLDVQLQDGRADNVFRKQECRSEAVREVFVGARIDDGAVASVAQENEGASNLEQETVRLPLGCRIFIDENKQVMRRLVDIRDAPEGLVREILGIGLLPVFERTEENMDTEIFQKVDGIEQDGVSDAATGTNHVGQLFGAFLRLFVKGKIEGERGGPTDTDLFLQTDILLHGCDEFPEGIIVNFFRTLFEGNPFEIAVDFATIAGDTGLCGLLALSLAVGDQIDDGDFENIGNSSDGNKRRNVFIGFQITQLGRLHIAQPSQFALRDSFADPSLTDDIADIFFFFLVNIFSFHKKPLFAMETEGNRREIQAGKLKHRRRMFHGFGKKRTLETIVLLYLFQGDDMQNRTGSQNADDEK